MADKVPQTRVNHTRFDPMFHFFLLPATVALFVWAVIHFVRHMDSGNAILAILALLLFLTTGLVRGYSLKVQDRVIRLEERLRLASLLPVGAPLPELTPGQWVALRFACDAEMPSLAVKAAGGNLKGKEIKDAIQTWRPDYFRV